MPAGSCTAAWLLPALPALPVLPAAPAGTPLGKAGSPPAPDRPVPRESLMLAVVVLEAGPEAAPLAALPEAARPVAASSACMAQKSKGGTPFKEAAGHSRGMPQQRAPLLYNLAEPWSNEERTSTARMISSVAGGCSWAGSTARYCRAASAARRRLCSTDTCRAVGRGGAGRCQQVKQACEARGLMRLW